MKLLAILLGSAWGRIGGSDSQGFRSLGIPVQIAYVQCLSMENVGGFLLAFIIIPLYIVWQWGMIQAFSYGLSAPFHKFAVKLFKGKGADGSYKPVEYVTRLLCAMTWCLPSILFSVFFGITGWLIYYVVGVILIPICGTFIKSAMWNEMLVWGILSLQVLI